ncbi:MAG: 4-(cytidine 5'-diphospho)-2-C-methyl-D-erythritol kinase [Candidatus Omnitrophota bacterium]|jgi:4-diphosphocytidyl-2-C-methyl-D-erythritol kinase
MGQLHSALKLLGSRGVEVSCYAKLNLFLEVIKKRPDNYHEIKTLFERIDLHDTLILSSLPGKRIEIKSNHPGIPKDSSNLAYKSAQFLQESLNINKGVMIKITKRIPVGAGMGGGSSDAAGVLLGLNHLWKLGLTRNKLVAIAKNIGSDVPFFMYDSPFALGSGRGEKIKPVHSLKATGLWHVLAVLPLHVSTPLIYKKWDQYFGRPLRLTIPKQNVTILCSLLKKKDVALIGKALFNSLEFVTVKVYPEVSLLKKRFAFLGLRPSLMSGSGPSVFALVPSQKEARIFSRQLKRENQFLRVAVTRTI